MSTAVPRAAEAPARAPRRPLVLVAPIVVAGAAAVSGAAWSFAQRPEALAAFAVLLAVAMLCEAFPVPVGRGGGNLSLGAIVVVATAALHGWAEAVLLAGTARAVVDGVQRRPTVRLAYNGSVYALGGALAGLAAAAVGGGSVARVTGSVLLATLAFFATLVVLVSAVVALTGTAQLRRVLADAVRDTAPSFAIMASVSLMLVVLWRSSPFYAAALAGPMIATALHQRSTHRTIAAMRLALTDPLTGLGNHRHFHEQLARALQEAAPTAAPVTLCLLDLDDFKHVNDTYGHPTGDAVLADVAASLRDHGDAFRVGGDEFALLLPGCAEDDARAIAARALERLCALRPDATGPLTFSAGVATSPEHGTTRTELFAAADVALYAAKRAGKNQLCVYERPLAAAV